MKNRQQKFDHLQRTVCVLLPGVIVGYPGGSIHELRSERGDRRPMVYLRRGYTDISSILTEA